MPSFYSSEKISTRSLSVLIPALNEEKSLAATVESVRGCVTAYFSDYEILIFNDGSSDQTGAVAEGIAAQDPSHIRVFHHARPQNLGACYREGIGLATKEYVILIPGDNECGTEVMSRVFARAGTADIILPYTANPEVRPWSFVALSLERIGEC